MKNTANKVAAEKSGMGVQVARNSIFGAIQVVISITVLLFITHYVLNTIGVERYAVWALVGLITAYGMLSDFGLTKAMVYFIPKARIEGGIAKINVLVSTTMSFYLITVTIIMAIMIILRNVIVIYLFRVPESLIEESMFVVTGAILIFGISILSGVFNSVLFGYQRVDIASFILIGYSILDPLGFYIVLRMGYGLPGLIVSRLITTILMTAAIWIAASRIAPGLRYNPKLSNRYELRSIFKYGINTQVETVSWVLNNSITKLLLPILAGLSFVSYFDLAWRTNLKASVLFFGAMRSVTPAAAELFAIGDTHRLRRLYFRSLRYIFLFALPLFLVIAILSQSFVRIWLGEGYELVAITIMLLSFPAFIGLLSKSSIEILKGIGQVSQISVVSAGSVVANLLLSLILGRIYGYFGVVIGMACVSLISSFILIRICNIHIGASLIEIPRHLSVGAMMLALFLAILVFATINFATNMSDLFNLIIVGSSYVICYFAGIFGLRLFDDSDHSLIFKLMPNWVPIKRFFRV